MLKLATNRWAFSGAVADLSSMNHLGKVPSMSIEAWRYGRALL